MKSTVAIFAIPLFLVSCAITEPVSIYDDTRLVYDEVTKYEYLQFPSSSIGGPGSIAMCDHTVPGLTPTVGPLGFNTCMARSYRLYRELPNQINLSIEYQGPLWMFIDKAIADGKPILIGKVTRLVMYGGTVRETTTAFVPIDEFASWSCKPARTILRIQGRAYADIKLSPETMRQFLGKAQALGFDVPEHGCTSLGIIADI